MESYLHLLFQHAKTTEPATDKSVLTVCIPRCCTAQQKTVQHTGTRKPLEHEATNLPFITNAKFFPGGIRHFNFYNLSGL